MNGYRLKSVKSIPKEAIEDSIYNQMRSLYTTWHSNIDILRMVHTYAL